MFQYEQSTGRMTRDGALVAVGYSGKDEAKNQPDLESVRSRGPIPRGRWRITEKFDSAQRGPFCLRLEPVGHDARGRSAFLIHGDSVKLPGTASEGCIILPRAARITIWNSDDRDLEVVR